MAKKVLSIEGDEGRALVGPNVSKRRGKDWGTDKGNRKSTLDKHTPIHLR